MKKLSMLVIICISTLTVQCSQRLYLSDSSIVHKLTNLAKLKGSYEIKINADTIMTVTEDVIKIKCGAMVIFDGGIQTVSYQSEAVAPYDNNEFRPADGALTKIITNSRYEDREYLFKKIVYYKTFSEKVYNTIIKDSVVENGIRKEIGFGEMIIFTVSTKNEKGVVISEKTSTPSGSLGPILKLRDLYHDLLIRAFSEKKPF